MALNQTEEAPKPEDYPTIQAWSDAYWDWAKRDMHQYIDDTWGATFKKAWKSDPVLKYLPLIAGLIAGALAFIVSIVIQLLIHYCK